MGGDGRPEKVEAQRFVFVDEMGTGEILLSREFLEVCLEERLSQEDTIVLDAHQREFFELVAKTATFRDVVAVPKGLLEAFFLAGTQDHSGQHLGSPRTENQTASRLSE